MTVNKKIMTVGPGSVKLGTGGVFDFTAEVSSAEAIPSTSAGTTIPLLSGGTATEGATTSWKVKFEVVQNLTVKGVVGYLLQNQGQVQQIEFTPNTVDGAKFVGQVRLDPPRIGGAVGKASTTTVELDVIGDLAFTPATKAGGLTP